VGPVRIVVHLSGRKITVALALATLGALVPCTPALAALTASSITSPANGAELFYDADRGSGGVTVAGTATGANPGTKGDLLCYVPHLTPTPVLATGVDLSDGKFDLTVSLSPAAHQSCRLAMVPSGTVPTGSAATAYAGPAISVSELASASDNGELYGYYILSGTLQWGYAFGSLGQCPVGSSYSTDPSSLGSYLLFGPSACLPQGNTSGSTAPTQSSLQIDGLNAYPPGAIGAVFKSGALTSHGLTGQPGFEPLIYSASFDPAHDTVTITESDPLTICDPPATYPPTPATCPALHDSGIKVDQTTTLLPGGQVARVMQRLTDVDGRAHTIDARFLQSIQSPDGSAPGFEFPNQRSFATHAKPDAFTDWLSGPQSIIALGDPTAAPSVSNPIGAITLNRPPSSAEFITATGASRADFQMHYVDSLPPGGSLLYDWSFSQSAGAAGLSTLEQLERDRMAAPAVTIYHPPNGSVARNSRLAISGRATDNVGVAAFTVAGSGVTLAADGSFSALVRLRPGKNTIVATASDAAGNSTSASIVVTFRPAPQCTVPRVAGLTLAAAKRGLARAHCGVGKVRGVRGPNAKRGRILSTNPRAGAIRPPGAKVAVTVGR
jgi:hypothetical protein